MAELSAEQVAYVEKRTNERGQDYEKPYKFVDVRMYESGGQPDWGIQIGVVTLDGEDAQSGRGKGRRDWLTNVELFHECVETAIDGCERHL